MEKREPDPLDRFRMTRSVLDDIDGHGDGQRVVYEDGVWRAWRVRRWRTVGSSSGGWNTMEEAVRHLPPAPEEGKGRKYR